MDINKWKSVAVRKPTWNLLQVLCFKEYRNPASFIELLVDKEVERRAKEKGMEGKEYQVKIEKEYENGDNGKKSKHRKK